MAMMITVEWKNLPSDILSILAKLLNSDVDYLRLRSVCSPWRSSLPPPSKPFSFPLELPPIHDGHFDFDGHFILDEITLYLISPPGNDDGDDDPSNTWLLRAITSAESNTFALLDSVTTERMHNPIPKQLNLLDHRISEISKYHILQNNKKVIPLTSYFTDCDFAVLVLLHDATISCWKLGDKHLTPIETELIHDIALYHGKCYAVYKWELACLDPDLKLTTVAHWPLDATNHDMIDLAYLVEYDSDLYVGWHFGWGLTDIRDVWQDPVAFMLGRFNERNGSLDFAVESTDAFFVFSGHASHSFNAKGLAGFKANRVYVHEGCWFDFEVKNGYLIGFPTKEKSDEEISPPNWLRV